MITGHQSVRRTEDVCAVTVTYGNRANLVLETTKALLNQGVRTVVIVDNGSAPEARLEIDKTYAGSKQVRVLHQERNRGSAGGFRVGLAEAVGSGHPLVLIMDDDNLLEAGALEHMLRCVESMGPKVIVAGNRDHNKLAKWVLSGVPAHLAYPPPGAFLSRDLIMMATRLGWSASRRVKRRGGGGDLGANETFKLMAAPYGGLLVPSEAIKFAGLPKAEYYLYGDDTEWTRRLLAAGWEIILEPRARIADIHESWMTDDGNTRAHRSENRRGLYYYVRNSYYSDIARARESGRRLRFAVNVGTVLSYLAITMMWSRRGRTNYRVVLRAVSDARANRMGEVSGFDL